MSDDMEVSQKEYEKEKEREKEHDKDIAPRKLILAACLFAIGLFFHYFHFSSDIVLSFGNIKINFKIISAVFLFFSYILCGLQVVKNAIFNILGGKVFDEQFLMSLASIVAIAIGQIPEALAVMLFYQIGEFFQDAALDRSHKNIEDLLESTPSFACVMREGKEEKVLPQDVKVGDTLIVRAGEKIATDGTITEGSSYLDASSITGESIPKRVAQGDGVFAGSINTQGLLYLKATKPYSESSIAKMMSLVEDSLEKKSATQKFITKFSMLYTPLVVLFALLLAFLPPIFLHFLAISKGSQESVWHFGLWVNRALIFLVISCPCALVISIPLGFMGGLARAAKSGILVKGSQYIETLAKTKIAVFDKTGTLTKGNFQVSFVKNTIGITQEELLKLACHAELCSNHPIASSLKKAHSCPDCQKIQSSAEEIAGKGVIATLDGDCVVVGSLDFVKENCTDFKDFKEMEDFCLTSQGAVVHVAKNGSYMGFIVIQDQMKDEAVLALKELKKQGVKKTYMLTGDKKDIAYKVAKDLGIDEVEAELLPEDKLATLETILAQKGAGCVLYAGDGLNDSPVLARADVGVGMGALGQAAAIDASDVVIMNSNLLQLPLGMKIAKNTMSIVKQNIVFCLLFKAFTMITGAIGATGLWFAVFSDVGVALLAVLNSTRQMLKKDK